MKLELFHLPHNEPFDAYFDCVLDEAGRALVEVDARADEPGQRELLSFEESREIGELRLALAELVDAHPGIHRDLQDLVASGNEGADPSTAHGHEMPPHVRELIRLSLEIFGRRFVVPEAYELEVATLDTDMGVPSPRETYAAFRRVREALTAQMS